MKDVQDRSIPVIKDLLHKNAGKTIIIGTHGNVMTIMMNYFDEKYGYDFWVNTTKPDIYRLLFQGKILQTVQREWE